MNEAVIDAIQCVAVILTMAGGCIWIRYQDYLVAMNQDYKRSRE